MRQSFDADLVLRIEAGAARTVEIDNRDDRTPAYHRNHELRCALGIACDVTGEGMYVFDQLRLSARCRCAADALADRNTDAGRPADERAEHKLAAHHAIEARPVEVRQKLGQKGRDVGHVRHAVRLAIGQGPGRVYQLAIGFGLGRIGSRAKVEHDGDVAWRSIRARAVAGARFAAYLGSMSIAKKLGLTFLVIVLILALALFFMTRGSSATLPIDQVTGDDPELTEPDAEWFPTVKIAEPIGWAANETPEAAAGLTVSRFAEGLDHPRTIHTLPNGDVLVSLTRAPAGEDDGGGIRGWIEGLLMSKAGATGASPDQVVLLRDTNGDGRADVKQVIADNLASPSGLAWQDGTLYIANHNAVFAYPYALGASRVGAPRKITDLAPGGGHWMRNLQLSADGTQLFVAVGSATNIADDGMEAEQGRALIWEVDLATGRRRQFAGGLRNPNGLAINPWSGELWTTVNERDMLGSDLVPDYLTNVPLGAQYGWPWVYWGDNYDRRVEYPIPDYINYVRRPEYALGLVFSREGAKMGERFGNGAFIARHGSWNRKPPSGYDVVYVAFDDLGNPVGKPVPVLSGFLTADGKTHGRPTWVDWASDGALLVSDDTAGIIWRTVAPNAQPHPAIERIRNESLPPQRELRGQSATFGADDFAREVPAQ